MRADRVVVVRDLERTEVVGTEVEGFLGIVLAAEAALQTQHGLSGHRRFSRCEPPRQSEAKHEKTDPMRARIQSGRLEELEWEWMIR